MQVLQASSYPFIPLSASYVYDSFDMDCQLQQWDDGSVTIDTPLLNNIKDVIANKNTLMYMTTAEALTTILNDTAIIISETTGNGTVGIIAANGKYVSVNGTSLSPTATSFGDTETFGLIANDDGTVSLLYNTSYIGVEPAPPWNVVVTNSADIINKGYHKFNIIQNGSKYLIQSMPIGTGVDGQTPPLFERYIKPVGGNGILRATGTNVINANLFTLSTITPGGGVIPGGTYSGFKTNTWWIKYYNTVNNQDGKNQTVDINFSESISGVKSNYLVTNAYKTKIDQKAYNNLLTIGNMNVDIGNLKTIATPSYEYAKKQGVNEVDSIIIRDYNKIFTGTNQEYGYENPFFGFTSDIKEVTFPIDKITYFHFPNTSEVTPLSTSGIIEGGAVAGSSPFRSDKIWKKNANYKKNIWWGDSLQWQQGTWLCSWLSGSLNSSTKPVWKDRWYNAGYVTYQQAITSYEEVFISNDPVVIDVDSSMTLDPRVWYKYHHIGNDYNQTIVNTLTGDGTALKLHYDAWASTVLDKSPYGNNGLLKGGAGVGSSKIGEKINDVLLLNGNGQYCYVPYNSSYDVTDVITHSVWVNATDWNNVKGNHILSNNFRGGWSLEWTNGFVNYIYPTYDSTYGHIMFTNIDDEIYSDKLLPISGSTFASPAAIAVDSHLFTWVLDNGPNKSLYKLDYNSDILSQISFDSTTDLQDIVIDGNNNIYVLDTNTSIISAFNTTTTSLVTSITSSYSNVNNIDVDTNNIIYGFPTSGMCIDNDNIVYYISGGSLIENVSSSSIYNDATLTDVACDKDNNLWLLTNITDFVKINTTGTVIVSGTVTTTNTDSTRGINFLNLYNGITYEDYAMILQGSDRTVYKYDMNGEYVSKIDLSDGINLDNYASHDKTLMQFDCNGDFTSYDWNRKFNYVKYNKGPQILSKITTRNGNDLTEITLNVPASSLSTGWHQFVTTYEGTSGNAKLYIDTVLTDTNQSPSSSEIYYQYENAFNIGVKSGVFRDLSDELEIDDYYFKGSIDDVRIYDWTINNSDINNIYMTRFDFSDLIWNMPIGDQNYVEEVERFFKNKLPGLKSQYFNIRLVNLGITDEALKTEIETIIKNTISRVAPAYSELYKIIWE